MPDKYDEWNILKKKIAKSNHQPPYFKEGDIWWVSIGYNIGNEVYGKGKDFLRPVLILKKFNKYQFLGIPLSSQIKNNPYYAIIKIKNRRNSALLFQIKTFSSLRLQHKLTDLNTRDFLKVKRLVLSMFK